MGEYLMLKWGTLKGWELHSEASLAAATALFDAGPRSISAAMQRDDEEQKRLLCCLIDAVDGPITNDWTGEDMTKDEAKRYVLEYRTPL